MPVDQAAAIVQVGQALGQTNILGRYIHHNNTYLLRYLRFSNDLPTAAGHLSFGSRRGAIFECYALLRCWHGFVTIRVRKIRKVKKRNNNNDNK